MGEIKYVGFYDTPENATENRNYVPSCATKMTYVASALEKIGCKVKIVSVSATKNRMTYPAKTVKISDGVCLQLFKTYPFGGKLQRIRSVLSMQLNLLKELLLRTSAKDTVLVYHSLSYMLVVTFAHRLRKFRLIIEAEEVYADVLGDAKIKQRELRFFERADAFVFPTALLHEAVNTHNKPYVVVHGTYRVEPDRGERFDDGKIHCVYAGTLDPRKGGALAAVRAAAFLDERYHMHILGFGTAGDRENLLTAIAEISEKTACTITFDGVKKGEEYIRFLQACHIGLSTQSPMGEYNDTSFPSKVLTYMANGLRVVSVRIKALETSAVNHLLHYYDGCESQAIANAILAVDCTTSYNGREDIHQLHRRLAEGLLEVFR